jgi:hypothetical protein
MQSYRSNNYSRRSSRLNAKEVLLHNIGSYADHLFQVLSWRCQLAIYSLIVLSSPRSSCFLNWWSGDLEYLSLKLCCNQYRSGIGWYMCVILRYGLSVFVCVFCFSEGGVRVDYCKIYVSTMSEISCLCPTWNPILITSSFLLLSFFRRWDMYRLIVKPKSDAVLGRIQVTRIRGKGVE